jgi:hypothetical protein
MYRTDKDRVDFNDMLLFRSAIGVLLGAAEYRPHADFDGNGTNDFVDAIKFLREFYAKSYP